MEMNDILQLCFSYGCTGKETDNAICSIGGNRLQEKRPVLAVKMTSVAHLAVMMASADNVHIFIEGGVFHFNALYQYTERFPAVRIYFIKMADLYEMAEVGVALEQRGINLLPINGPQFSQLIDERNYLSRFKRWRADYRAKGKIFSDLFDGRIKNTAVEKGFWLSTDGRCLLCGKATNRMATSTLMGEKGVMMGFQLCKKHQQEAAHQPNTLGYLAGKFGISLPFASQQQRMQHDEMSLEMTCEALKNELACEIEKVSGQTITARRPSGARVIIRQDSLNSYAYNFFAPDGKPVARIDSADHHVVNYGPAHIHRALSQTEKNNVETSYTYGFAVADLKVIKQLLALAEQH